MNSVSASSALHALANAFSCRGYTLYSVGGTVRNQLLSLPVSDTDICSAMRPDDVRRLCADEGFSCFEKGAFFGTLDIEVVGERFEYACFRRDSYAPSGAHRPECVRYSDNVEDDAVRRDFTVNAIYFDIATGRILDPTGGLCDLERRVIRATSPDPCSIMGADALRILRMARFSAQLGFTIDKATLDAARSSVRGLADISAERVLAELELLLLSDIRYGSGAKSLFYGLEALHLCGAFGVILPELAACEGVAQKKEYHAYDVLYHSLHAAECAAPTLTLRLAALFHDIGKPDTFLTYGNMHGHEELSANMANALLLRLKAPNALRERVTALIRYHMYDIDGRAKEATLRKRFAALGLDTALELCALREADVHGSGIIRGEVNTAARWREIIERMKHDGTPTNDKELACTGMDIARWLNIPPGAEIGRIKRALLAHCAARPQDNRQEKLYKLALDMQRRPVK